MNTKSNDPSLEINDDDVTEYRKDAAKRDAEPWMSMENELPPPDEFVWVYGDGHWDVDSFSNPSLDDMWDFGLTHWQPLTRPKN